MKKLGVLVVIMFASSLMIMAQQTTASLLCSADNITINDNDKNTNSASTKSFEVTANPVNESVSVKFNVNASIESVKMINNNSSVVFETGKSRGAAGSVLEIPVEDMEPGTYFIRVQTESGVQVQRIIISK
jgi:hypothetical protein